MAVESMKLLSDIVAPRAGTVAAIHVAPGAAFAKGTALVSLEAIPCAS
jgi:biotin carboxyl carrier protein